MGLRFKLLCNKNYFDSDVIDKIFIHYEKKILFLFSDFIILSADILYVWLYFLRTYICAYVWV